MSDLWAQLDRYHAKTRDRTILSLFDDPSRFDAFSIETDGLLLDISKTSIDNDALAFLL